MLIIGFGDSRAGRDRLWEQTRMRAECQNNWFCYAIPTHNLFSFVQQLTSLHKTNARLSIIYLVSIKTINNKYKT